MGGLRLCLSCKDIEGEQFCWCHEALMAGKHKTRCKSCTSKDVRFNQQFNQKMNKYRAAQLLAQLQPARWVRLALRRLQGSKPQRQ